MRGFLSGRLLQGESLLEVVALFAIAGFLLCLLIWLHLI